MCKIAISPKKTPGKRLFVVRTKKVRFFIFRAYIGFITILPLHLRTNFTQLSPLSVIFKLSTRRGDDN